MEGGRGRQINKNCSDRIDLAIGISIVTSYDNDGYEMGIIAWRWRGWLTAMGRSIGLAVEFVTAGRLIFGRMGSGVTEMELMIFAAFLGFKRELEGTMGLQYVDTELGRNECHVGTAMKSRDLSRKLKFRNLSCRDFPHPFTLTKTCKHELNFSFLTTSNSGS